MIDLLLYIALIYLLINSAIFYSNYREFTPLRQAKPESNSQKPKVSVCIPARNEENVIERALNSVLNQDYGNIEVLVLDDESTDRTPAILNQFSEKYPDKLKILSGQPKPADWLGKSWACHQLSNKASGDILLFIDADVWLSTVCVQRIVQSMQKFSVDFITVWPVQKMGTFWERVVIPLIYYGLFTLLPAKYVHQKPRWWPSYLSKKIYPEMAAACGQCMVFRRLAYNKIDGHRAVKNDIVEDVALSKNIKRNGLKMRMFHGDDAVWCRMYTSASKMWNGFRKNFLALFNNSVPAFIGMAVVNFVVFILPIIILIQNLFSFDMELFLLSVVCLAIFYAQRVVLQKWYGWKLSSAIWHPLAVLWFHALGMRVLWDHLRGQRAQWKNRPTN